MKKFIILLLIILTTVLTACSKTPSEESSAPQFLDVELEINPEKIEPNQTTIIEAEVTYGDEKVEDADEVKFEIWRAHDKEHEKIVVKHASKGIYRLEKEFSEEGTYYVVAHVTARGMHNMPKEEFIVGKASEPEEETSTSGDMEDEDQHEEHHEDSDKNDHEGH